MAVVIILILAIIIVSVYWGMRSTKNSGNNSGEPGTISGTMKYLHAYNSFKNKHSSYDSGVFIGGVRTDIGYEIQNHLVIYKIDGENASETIDSLKWQTNHIRNNQKNRCGDDLLAQSQAVDKWIADFWGTDRLPAKFWDVADDNFEYIDDDRYIEFEDAVDFVPKDKSIKATLKKIEDEARRLYPNAKITSNINDLYLRVEM